MDNSLIIIVLALIFLGLGLVLLFAKKLGTNRIVTSWLLIAMSAAFLFYRFFPESEASGKLFNVQVGGALAFFMLTWISGYRFTMKLLPMQTLKQELEDCKKSAIEIQNLKKENEKIVDSQIINYEINNSNKKIGIITGDLVDVKNVDIWVNSENTNMQMARHFDNSISALIRYHGAKKNEAGFVIDDIIFNNLAEQTKNFPIVPPASVFVGISGELEKSNGVKKILHVATVHGEAGKGYQAISNINACLTNSLQKISEINDPQLKSIVFPLLGTGSGGHDNKNRVSELFETAIKYLSNNPKCSIEIVYFLAYTKKDLKNCLYATDNLKAKLSLTNNSLRNLDKLLS